MIRHTISKSVHGVGCAALIAAILVMTSITLASSTESSRIYFRMHQFRQAARIYHQNNDKYPVTDEDGTWYEKLVFDRYFTLHEGETTSDGSLPVDSNGNLFIYELPLGANASLSMSSRPILRYVGVNGIDDKGKGDDIDLRYGVNYGYYYKAGYPYALAIHVLGLLLTIALIRPFFRAITTWKYRFSFFLIWVSAWTGAGGIVGSHGGYADVALLGIMGALLGFISCFVCSQWTWIIRVKHEDLRLANVCVVCKYDLRGTEGPICPECGRDKTEY